MEPDPGAAADAPAPPSKLRRAVTGLAWAGGLYALWLLLAISIQRDLIYPRGHAGKGRGVSPPAGAEQLWIEADEGVRVEAWYVQAPGATAARPGPALIYSHGNAELIDTQDEVIRGCRKLGISVVLCEYRGYGRSTGKPTQAGIVRDQARAYDWLVEHEAVDPKRVVIAGRSLGTGVACALAAQRPSRALILISPFRSVRSMVRGYGLWGPFVLDPFDSEAVLRDYPNPVRVIHGRRDGVIPFAHGEHLARVAARGELSAYENAGHNDLPLDWALVQETLVEAGVLQAGASK